MSLEIKVQNSCKYLSVSAQRQDNAVTTATIQVSNLDSGGIYSTAMNYLGGGAGSSIAAGSIIIPIANLDSSNGVFKVCQIEGGIEVNCKPIIIKCDIDCCLTKLTNELVECDCDCPRCATSLAKAQKVFLLLQSAISTTEIAGEGVGTTGYYVDVLSKYKKAREICDNSCGCDC